MVYTPCERHAFYTRESRRGLAELATPLSLRVVIGWGRGVVVCINFEKDARNKSCVVYTCFTYLSSNLIAPLTSASGRLDSACRA